MRAREPDHTGRVERDGVSVGYEVFGDGGPTIVLLTSWAIVHMRQWKAQVPYLSRHFRVITVEGRATGGPTGPTRPTPTPTGSTSTTRSRSWTRTGIDRAVLAGCRWVAGTPCSSRPGTRSAQPGSSRSGRRCPGRCPPDFDEPKDSYEGWGKANRHYWLRRLPRLGRVLHVPGLHRAALDQASGGRRRLGPGDRRRDPAAPTPAIDALTEADAEAICRAVRCPVLVVHGDGTASCRTRPVWRWRDGPAGSW